MSNRRGVLGRHPHALRSNRSRGGGFIAVLGVIGLIVGLVMARQDDRVARAATLPANFTETVVASGLANPTAMAFAPDGRVFVAEQGGSLRVIKNGSLLATPFLTVNVDDNGERGLLGVAFHPNFGTAGSNYVYIYYTTGTSPVHNRLSRFAANGDVASGSEQILMDLDNLSGATNHNGGAIHFGNDGKLYIAVGDNANGGAAQSLDSVFGKILRVNADGSIPSDNPFFGSRSGNDRAIWALGLRNPFTFSVQRTTGRIFINDVGQGAWEEINDGVRGANYGWPNTEGETSDPDFESPVYHRRRLLQSADHDVPLRVRGQVLLCRLLRRLDPPVRSRL
jgi:glucose/arabinose dehydrogenase